MSMDSIGDFLTIIRNGIHAAKRSVSAPFSNQRLGIASLLKEEGYIKDFEKIEAGCKSQLKIVLKYVDGESAIQKIVRISTPGRRHYEDLSSMKPVAGGLGVSILTTNVGIITDRQARKLKVGGEVICHIR